MSETSLSLKTEVLTQSPEVGGAKSPPLATSTPAKQAGKTQVCVCVCVCGVVCVSVGYQDHQVESETSTCHVSDYHCTYIVVLAGFPLS